MKEGWEYKSLGEVCKIYNGNSINADYKKEHFLGATGGLPFIATKDVSPLGTIDYNNGVRIPNYEEYKVAPANSVFICAEGGSAGKKFAYVEKDVCFGNKLFCITPKDKAIKGKFIYHFVQSDNFRGQFFSLLTGLIGGVSAKKFQTIEIPVPSLSEQQSIVDYLDSAFAKIDAMKANAEKSLNEAKALFQASLKEMLEPKEGWEEKTIEYFAKIIHGKNQKEVLDDNGLYPIYGSGGNIMGYANSYLCDEGTTILGRKGTIDNPLYIDEKFWNVDTAFGIIAKDNCNKKFLYYSILNVDWAKYNTGTTLPSLTQNVVYNVHMCAPSLSAQRSIVVSLDSLKSKVDRLQANFEKISQECDALKQAILKNVFE